MKFLEIVDACATLAAADRRRLVKFLSGGGSERGRPRIPHADREAYRALIAEAKARRRADVAHGKGTYQAKEDAAKWASRDPRARGKRPTTIERDMDRKLSKFDRSFPILDRPNPNPQVEEV